MPNSPLNTYVIGRKQAWLSALLALGWITSAWGETRINPTLPPPSWLATQPGTKEATPATIPEAKEGMRMIVIGRSRRFALIDGQKVKHGDTYNGTSVVAIRSDEIVMADPSKSLKLLPGVERKTISPTPQQAAGPRRTKSKNNVSQNENGSSQ